MKTDNPPVVPASPSHVLPKFFGWVFWFAGFFGITAANSAMSARTRIGMPGVTAVGWIVGPAGASSGHAVGAYLGYRLGGGAGAFVSGATGAFLGGLSGAPPSHSVSAPSVELSPASWVGSSLGSCMPSWVPSGPCFNDLIPDAQQPR